jgi:septal ring factor EnvC (AmiA/AmiB activator)
MPDQPEDLTLRLLRDIRAKLDEHDKRFDAHDKRFDTLEERMDDLRTSMTYGLGLAMHAQVRHDGVAKKIEDIEGRLTRLEERA